MSKRLFVVLSILLTVSIMFTACGQAAPAAAAEEPVASDETMAEEAPAAEEAPSLYKIGILAPAVTHGWVAAVAYNAEQRCLELADQVEYKLYTSSNAEENDHPTG